MNDLRAALESDIDVMRDVYMTRSQREAFDRLLARLTGEDSEPLTPTPLRVNASGRLEFASTPPAPSGEVK